MKYLRGILKKLTPVVVLLMWQLPLVVAQSDSSKISVSKKATVKSKKSTVLYGEASFYSNKFHGRLTANGEIFSQYKMTAACNALPLGTWIRVTNLKNGKIIVVKTNDRLHPKTRRLVDLTRTAAQKLGFISRGLTRVKVEVLGKKPLQK